MPAKISRAGFKILRIFSGAYSAKNTADPIPSMKETNPAITDTSIVPPTRGNTPNPGIGGVHVLHLNIGVQLVPVRNSIIETGTLRASGTIKKNWTLSLSNMKSIANVATTEIRATNLSNQTTIVSS